MNWIKKIFGKKQEPKKVQKNNNVGYVNNSTSGYIDNNSSSYLGNDL